MRDTPDRVSALSSSSRDMIDVTQAQDQFVQAWGRMGSAWGISRTMGEVHALLYITAQAMCTDDVMDRLQISRGNASMTLRALLDWGVISRIDKPGDRREYYIAESDVWTMFHAIIHQRVQREVEPVLAMLYEIRDMTGTKQRSSTSNDATIATHNERLDEMLRFFETLEKLRSGITGPRGRGLRFAVTALAKVLGRKGRD